METWTSSTKRVTTRAEFVQDLFPDRPMRFLVANKRSAVFSPLPEGLHPNLVEAIQALGITEAYSHQSHAVNLALDGQNVIVTTGTGSGKSACGVWPALHRCLAEPAARALFIFPTKSLAQDQLAKITLLADKVGLRVGAYDGDTPKSERSAIRKHAHIVVTNPDMLHLAILPQHELWASFLKGLRTVVVDEAHVYRGLFGGHMSMVMRRLLRLGEWHRARPLLIGLSATLADPAVHFKEVTGRDARVVDLDGSGTGMKVVVLIPPPAEGDFSPNSEVARLTAELIEGGDKTLTFCRSRISTELILRDVRRKVAEPESVESYRSGYTPEQRRQIERDLFSGKLKGLVATNALELGVDIGGLDTVVMNGFPGSFTSLWQQVGRSGRGGLPGTAVLLAHSDPMENLIATDPEWLAKRGIERLGPSRSNPVMLKGQLLCAAYERPLKPEELPSLAPLATEMVQELLQDGSLAIAAGQFFYPSHNAPHPSVRIRGGSSLPVHLTLGGKVLGEMEEWRAMAYAHVGAVYLHRGETYRVMSLDWLTRTAILVPHTADDYTVPLIHGLVEPSEQVNGDDKVGLWALQVTSEVVGYKRVALPGQEVIEELPLEPMRHELSTIGIRVTLPAPQEEDMIPFITGLHTLEHGLRATAPLVAGCAPGDFGTHWGIAAVDNLQPTVWLYDGDQGGNGVSQMLFQGFGEWLELTRRLAEECSCDDGCPLCVLSPRCEAANELVSRRALVWLFEHPAYGGILRTSP